MRPYPKFKLTNEHQQELLAGYLPYCTTMRMPAKLPSTPECRDNYDMPFLQLAVAGQADYLVSGDQDLLGLAGQFSCPIITADQFMEMLQN